MAASEKSPMKVFAEETSLHGIPYVISSSSKSAKIGWTVIFCLALLAFVSHILTLMVRYFQYPSGTVVYMSDEQVDFPLITVYPHRQVNMKELYEMGEEGNMKELYQMGDEVIDTGEIDCSWLLVQEFNNTFLRKAQMDCLLRSPRILAQFLPKTPVDFATSTKEIFLDCDRDIQPCNHDRFKILTTFSPEFNGCHTLSFMKNQSTVLSGRKSGAKLNILIGNTPFDRFALSVYNINKYFSGIKQGARLLIHLEGTLPHPDSAYIDIIPFSQTSLSLNMEKVIRLPVPYHKCATENYEWLKLESILKNNFAERPEGGLGLSKWAEDSSSYSFHGNSSTFKSRVYEVVDCTNACLQCHIWNKCKCLDVDDFPIYPSPVLNRIPLEAICYYTSVHDISACLQYKPEEWEDHNDTLDCKEALELRLNQRNCINDMKKQMQEAKLTCECAAPCKEHVYKVNAWSLDWSKTGGFEHGDFAIDLGDGISYDIDSGRHYAEVLVYFQTNTVYVTEQVPSYPWIQLLADIGGACGLWIGVSIITITEILAFLYSLVRVASKAGKESAENQQVELAEQ